MGTTRRGWRRGVVLGKAFVWFALISIAGCGPGEITTPRGNPGGTESGPGLDMSPFPFVDMSGFPGTDMPVGSALTCASPAAYASNWTGGCGTERWPVKIGTDSTASLVNLSPTLTSIAYLTSLPSPATKPSNSRVPPVEETTFELQDVTLIELKLETDSDYHMVLSDGATTMIAEIPYPIGCVPAGSPFECMITHARAVADKFSPTPSFRTVNTTVTIVGVGFFDFAHGQTGVAPNAIELHPVLAMCVGAGCDPRAT